MAETAALTERIEKLKKRSEVVELESGGDIRPPTNESQLLLVRERELARE